MFEFFETLAPENEERLSDKRSDRIKSSVLSRIEEGKPMKKHFRIKPLLIAAIISVVAAASVVGVNAASDSGLFQMKINGQIIENDVDLSEVDVFNQPQGLKLTFNEETGEVSVEPVEEGANAFYYSLTLSNSIGKLGFTLDMDGHMEVYTGDDVAILDEIPDHGIEGKYVHTWHLRGGVSSSKTICPPDYLDCWSSGVSDSSNDGIVKLYGYYSNDDTIKRIYEYYWDRISPDDCFHFSIEYDKGEYKAVLGAHPKEGGEYEPVLEIPSVEGGESKPAPETDPEIINEDVL